MPTAAASASAAILFVAADKMKMNAKKISFCAIMSALGCAILYLGSLIEVMDMSMAAIASFLVVICMIEMGGYAPLLVYASTSLLSFLLLPNKTVVLIYLMFFGFYPIIKKHLEKLGRIWSLVLKLITFNALLVLYMIVAEKLLHISLEPVGLYLVILLNVIFFTLDFALTVFVTAYVVKYRKRLQIDRFFRK
ncbi:MAG: hypothetical protein IKL40_03705 [Clostridia bacterium]|nr:hypothetical protein [Clostridia bacterium]